MITLGAKWRVGDGRCIRIYGENWIPVEGLGKVISPRTSLAANALVAELIHPVSGWWDSQIIDSNFLPFEAQRIKAIPISSVAWEDTLIWPKSSDGTYSVKTGYRTLCEESSGDFASVSGTGTRKIFWSGIWKLPVPGKIKHFLWRACSDSLPTKQNLWRRKTVGCPKCEVCNSYPENTIHALWDCEDIRDVWERDFNWIDRGKAARGSFVDLWEMLGIRPDTRELFAVTAWHLWNRRNKARLKHPISPLNHVPTEAHHYLSEYKKFNRVTVKHHKPRTVRWKPTDAHHFKTNFDGAFFAETGEAGIDVVIRNNTGQVKAALSEKIHAPASVTVLEMLAARRAAAFTREMGIENCILEGDSQIVIKALQDGDMTFSESGHLLQDTLSHLNSIKNWSLSHSLRQGNAVADALAKRAKFSFPLPIWLESVPPDSLAFLNADLPPS